MVNRLYFPFISILILIIAIYSNAFTAPWFFDDIPNIVNNSHLHIDNIMPETIWQTFFAKPFRQGNLYRPVACLSFALNWFVGQDNTVGYHIVNVVIHYLTSVFLLLTIVQMFRTPILKHRLPEDGIYFTAFLTAVLWAVHPIQTQAVTYIVQRMASLAGMFYIIALYCYITGRLQTIKRIQYRYFAMCICSFLFALASKENAVLLPFSLLLIEYTFFIREKGNTNSFYLTILSMVVSLIVVAGFIYLFNSGLISGFFDRAGSRPFSPYERALTETRVLLYYLGLIFYPTPSRFSIDHDFPLSTSLAAPWSTAMSVTAVLVMIILAFRFIHKRPLVCFAVLFYFINHLVESTILPLELIFEHRNYIPSFFLFLPLTVGIYSLLMNFLIYNRFKYIGFITFLIMLVSSVGMASYIRNMTYTSSEALWRDSLKKAPHSARALSNLGIDAGWEKDNSLERLQEALYLNYKALNSYHQRITYKPAIILNMGNLLFNYGYYDQAIDQYNKALSLNPNSDDVRYHLAQAYVKNGKFRLAADEISKVIDKSPPNSLYFNVHGLAMLWLDRPEEALLSFRKACTYSRTRALLTTMWEVRSPDQATLIKPHGF
jgi:Tfp pilus assembly protein PilF